MEKLELYHDLVTGLRSGKPRPDKQTASFCAASLIANEAPTEELTTAIIQTHNQIRHALGRSRAPNGGVRWLYASLLTDNNIHPDVFLNAREALRSARKSGQIRSLYAGGSRAALVLSVSSEPDPAMVERFAEFKSALTPPWWRRNDAITDTFAAAHASTDQTVQAVLAMREAALEVFQAHRLTRGYKREGARQCALLDQPPASVLERFLTLEDARRANRFLKHRSDRSLTMQWAVEGLTPADLEQISDIIRALKSGPSGAGHLRTRLAHLIHTDGGRSTPAGSLSAFSAVLAAQAAVVATTVAATSVVVTAGS